MVARPSTIPDMDKELILQNVKKLISLTEAEEQYFLSLLKPRMVRKRQFLLQAGDVCRYEYFVTAGCLRAYYNDDSGQEHNVQFAIEDWWIGDMKSFLTQTPAWLCIDALEDAEVLMLGRESMDALYEQVPAFERYFRIRVQRAFITEQQRISSSLSKTAEDRYIEFIQRYPKLEQRVPQVQVASYLGITPEFLSTIRGRMARRNKS